MLHQKSRSGWTRTLLPALGRLILVAAVAGCGGTDRARTVSKPSVTGQYAFWPMPPADPHLQFLQPITSRDDVATKSRSVLDTMVFGEEDQQTSAINKPYGVDMRDGRLYVCDMRNRTLVVLDFKKHQMRLIGATGFNALTHPVDVEVADDDMVYVADNERNAVFVFDANEKYVKVIGHDEFRPVGLATFGDRLYVCNLDLQIVEIFNRFTGESLGSIGEVGDEDGQFRVPLGIDTDIEGNVYVVDLMRCRLQKFSPDGDLLAAVGTYGDAPGSFVRPKHIAVDSDGIVYVVDAAFQNVQMFDSQFRLLMHFGAGGNFAGAMNLPAGICVDETSVEYFTDELHPGFDAKRLVIVTNQFGFSKVGAYAMGERREGWSIAELTANAADIELGVGANPEALELQTQLEEPAEEPAGGEQDASDDNADGGNSGN
jgi:sugar lactone lactonase YvrE